MSFIRPRITVLVLSLIVLVASCGKKDGKDDFSSARNLYVDYISSYSSGIMSRTSDIKIKFAKEIEGIEIGQQADGLFEFSPSIAGSAVWEDKRTLVFSPNEPLPSGTKYEATLALSKIITDVPSDRKEFNFIFESLIQNYDVSITGLELYNATDIEKMKLTGTLQTADFADNESIEKILQAQQNGNNLSITWDHTGENQHLFIVENVIREEDQQEVKLSLNGSSIGVDKNETQNVEVPPLNDYKVVSVQIKRTGGNYISVLFSEPISEKQSLQGLVELNSRYTGLRLVVNLNELKIFPSREMYGPVDLKIYKNLKNIAGYSLKEDYSTQLQFSQNKPSVRLADEKDGAILPNSKGLILPFEAVALKAVEVTVVKVFEENVLQYLQVNKIGGRSQMSRVARPVAKVTVPLNKVGVTNLNEWNRYTLDLAEHFQAEPGAIYEVRIGFSKKNSLYFCADSEESEYETLEEENWGPEEESSYWDYSEDYYYNDYEWQDRDNPCSNSYYGGRRTVSKVLFASDLGIIAKKRDGGKVHAFITNLLDTEPQSDVSVAVYDYQQQVIGSGITNTFGSVEIETNGKPYMLAAKKDNQTGYLKLDDGSSLSLSNFNVSGQRIKKGIKGFIYGERGVWRPADTVHLAFILEDKTGQIPDNHPVIMELWNPLGQLHSRKVSSQPVGDIYRFDMITESEDPTGNWMAKVKVGGVNFSKSLKIETVKPNRLKIDLDFGKDVITALDNEIAGDLNVKWLTGATAANLRAEFEVFLTARKTTFEDYPNFSFDDAAKEFYGSTETIYSGRLNSDGYARVIADISASDNAPGALTAVFKGKVFEEGGDFSIDKFSMPFYPYESFVGVKLPEGDRRGMLLTDEDHEVRVVTVDAKGNPVSRNGLKVNLYKLNWRWWWDNSYNDISSYVGRGYRDPIQNGTINTTNGEGKWKLRINYPDWGRYYVQIEDPESGHTTGKVVYVDWPGWAGKGKNEMGGASMLSFNIEKSEYETGEDIKISFPSTAGNRALISLESGSEVLQTFWVETEDESTSVSIEATADMSPNVYLNITMIQPHAQENNDLPIRLYGIESIKVVDPGTKLDPILDMPDELQPEQKFTVKVKEDNGKPMAYTLAVVDEGLLDLTKFKTPDAWSNFYKREALGIKTWDVYDDVMGAYGGTIERLLAVGGDGDFEEEEKEQKEANRFKPVVMYVGPFYLEGGETATHELQMPQYVGSVKTMVVAAKDGAYGRTDKATPVRQPMMILATMPRVAGPGEDILLPVNVFTMKDDISEVKLKVEPSGLLKGVGATERTVKFSKAGDKIAYFNLKVDETIGYGAVKVTATAGNLTANYDVELNVLPRNPTITDVVEKVLDGSENWQLNYEPLGIAGTNEGTIELSSLPPLNIDQRLQYLIKYPHGCIEQTTSSVFAQLYLDNLTELKKEYKDRIQTNINAAINRLKSFQTGSGGFAYWPGNSEPNLWGSNYAGHFLVEAKNKGYNVPQSLWNNWISFQTQQANNWNGDDYNNDLTQAYRLYTLALAKKPAVGAMNRMRENANLSKSAKWRLALAYATAGYTNEAAQLVQDISYAVDNSDNTYRYTYGSGTRNRAMILETLIKLDRKADAFSVLNEIAKEMGDSKRWMSTQTTAYCFIAIAQYANQFPVDEALNATATIGGATTNVTKSDYVSQVYLEEADKGTSISVKNNGQTPVYARVIRKGIPLEGDEIEGEKNLRMTVKYMDMDGKAININRMKQGTDFMAQVTITNPGIKGKYEDVALTQIFPSGWEIINNRLDGTEEYFQQDKAEYTDIRDDRVMNYFDIASNKSLTFKVLLNAAYRGKYYLPAVSTEAMYDETIYSHKAGKWVEVTQ